MRWDNVVAAVVTAVNADAALSTATGGETLKPWSASADIEVPALRYEVAENVPGESTELIGINIAYWITGMSAAATVERRLIRVLHNDEWRTLGGVYMATLHRSTTPTADPDPGVVHRTLSFHFQPVREKYT